MGTASQSVSSFQAALAWKLDHTLERVPSLCPTRQGNSLRRGMEGTLGLKALSTPLKVRGLPVLSQVRGLRASLRGEAVSTWEAVQLYCGCTHYGWTGSYQFVCTVLYNSITGFLAWPHPVPLELAFSHPSTHSDTNINYHGVQRNLSFLLFVFILWLEESTPMPVFVNCVVFSIETTSRDF